MNNSTPLGSTTAKASPRSSPAARSPWTSRLASACSRRRSTPRRRARRGPCARGRRRPGPRSRWRTAWGLAHGVVTASAPSGDAVDSVDGPLEAAGQVVEDGLDAALAVHPADDLPDGRAEQRLHLVLLDPRDGLGDEQALQRHGEGAGPVRVVPGVGPLGAQLACGLAGQGAGADGVAGAGGEQFPGQGAASACRPRWWSARASRARRPGRRGRARRRSARRCRCRRRASTGNGSTASTTSGVSTMEAISPVWPPAS